MGKDFRGGVRVTPVTLTVFVGAAAWLTAARSNPHTPTEKNAPTKGGSIFLVARRGFEPLIFSVRGRRPGPG